MIPA
ncbi:hypothetical protein D018_1314A, partial [Vibrio parahaemolyticus VP2007-007]|jgi:hypothetical protein